MSLGGGTNGKRTRLNKEGGVRRSSDYVSCSATVGSVGNKVCGQECTGKPRHSSRVLTPDSDPRPVNDTQTRT